MIFFVCVCLYLRPLVRLLFPNHEMVVFQPQTGTAPDLGFIADYKFYSIPPALPFSTVFLDIFMVLFGNNQNL